MFCPVCGKPLPDQARFCDRCGAMIAQQPAAPQPASQPTVRQEEKKRTPVFGVLMLIAVALYEILEFAFRALFMRMIYGEDVPFLAGIRMMYGTVPNVMLRFFGLTAMILIAVYHLAGYPKRKLTVLGAIGAILMVISKIPLNGNIEWMIGCMLIIVGAVLLAVYWFMKEKAAVLGIIGGAVCLTGTLFYLLSDLIGVGGSVLITVVILAADLILIAYWVFVLVAAVAGRKKTV